MAASLPAHLPATIIGPTGENPQVSGPDQVGRHPVRKREEAPPKRGLF